MYTFGNISPFAASKNCKRAKRARFLPCGFTRLRGGLGSVRSHWPAHLRFILTTACIFVTHLASSPLQAEQEQFEGPNPSWQAVGGDAEYRVIRQSRTRDEAHAGAVSEHLEVAAGNGSQVYFSQTIEPAKVIGELQPSLWVKADRPGITLLARVILPRSPDPVTGAPLSVYLTGDVYQQTGSWQQLRLKEVPALLTRQIRILRNQVGPQVDSREAYIDQVVLNVYAGQGTTRVWIDDLEVAGAVGLKDVVARAEGTPRSQPAPAKEAASTRGAWIGTSGSDGSAVRQAADWTGQTGGLQGGDLKLQGSRLMFDGHAILPRIIEYRGESLATLQQLGFNMVWLNELPDTQLLAAAREAGLWLICPPPTREQIDAGMLTTTYDIVAAWNLGLERTGGEMEQIRHWAEKLHTKDPVIGRPILIGCHDELRAFSRLADVVLIGRSPLGTSLTLTEYARHLASQPRLARPGTPLWVRVPSDPAAPLVAQWSALGRALNGDPTDRELDPANRANADLTLLVPPGAGISPQQLRTVLYTALAAGSRGFLFHSRTPLDANDRETRRRRAMLELLNLELALIEPWAAGGSFVTSAPSTDPQLFGVALQTDRARLLLPVRSGPLDQFVPEPIGWQARAFTVPGVPESNDAFELTPAGVRQLTHKRVTGGIRVSQETYAGGALVVMSSDPRIASGLSRQVVQTQRRAAELKRELALTEMQNTESVERRLTPSPQMRDVAELLSTARAALDQASTLLTAGDWRRSYEKSETAQVILSRLQRRRWEEIAMRWPSIIASPVATVYGMLPQHESLMTRLNSAQVEPSLLAGGDMEQLDGLLEAGWRHYLHPQPAVGSDVELSPAAPHGGRFALRLRSWSDDQETATAPIETSPVWVTSAPVSVQAGDLLRLRGFVRVPKPIIGSVDGLLILDSLGGLPLAERVSKTSGWQEFSLFRAASQAGEITLTFAISGLGEAYIDDVTIEVIRLLPPGATTTPRPNPPTTPARLSELFNAPGARR